MSGCDRLSERSHHARARSSFSESTVCSPPRVKNGRYWFSGGDRQTTMLKPARADADGDNDDTDNDEAPCFLKGTRVRTIKGERKVEDLAIGDLLPTHSNGIQPIKSVVIDSAGVMLRGLG